MTKATATKTKKKTTDIETQPAGLIEEDEAPHEAFCDMDILNTADADGDALITACDGEQHYIFVVSRLGRGGKTAKTFTVREVYPGLALRTTEMRGTVKTEADLELDERFPTNSAAFKAVRTIVMEGLEAYDAGTVAGAE